MRLSAFGGGGRLPLQPRLGLRRFDARSRRFGPGSLDRLRRERLRAQVRLAPAAAETLAEAAEVAPRPAEEAASRAGAAPPRLAAKVPVREAEVARQAAVAPRPAAESRAAEVAPPQAEAAQRLAVEQGLEAAARPESGRRLELAEARIGRPASAVRPEAQEFPRAEPQARCRRPLPSAVRPAGAPDRRAKARRREARSRRR